MPSSLAPADRSNILIRRLLIISVALSSFLLFQVQPLISKYILPWFGGSPSVWTTSMLFFMTALLAGYAYAHWLNSYVRQGWRLYIHGLVLLASLVLIGYATAVWPSPITPSSFWQPGDPDQPIGRILIILLISVGLPYTILSSTTSLTQSWWRRQSAASPYRLYAVSNAASFLALVTYPVLFEPVLSIFDQSRLWAVGFAGYAAILLFVMIFLFSAMQGPQENIVRRRVPSKITLKSKLIWLGLPALSAILLLAATNQMSQQVATVPFLWVLPLSLYLLSFVISFSDLIKHHRLLYSLMYMILFPMAFYFTVILSHALNLLMQIIYYAAIILVACLLLHSELYRSRPPASRLTAYYLYISIGSVIGAVFVSLIAPFIWSDFHEYPLILTAIGLLNLVIMRAVWLNDMGTRQRRYISLLFLLIILSFGAAGLFQRNLKYNIIEQIRNFYGVITIQQNTASDGQTSRTEMHSGGILHGFQLTTGDNLLAPTSYYTLQGGGGLAITSHQKYQTGQPLRVGVIGLGAGTLAAYCRPGDYIQFYDINPAVARLAGRHFSFLDHCRDIGGTVDVVLGDARLKMAGAMKRHDPGQLDVLLIDAFTDDAIPVHLLTREAMQVYQYHLAERGIIAVHISNRYINLEPALAALAGSVGLNGLIISNRADQPLSDLATASSWVLLAEDFLPAIPASSLYEQRDLAEVSRAQLWTDNYSNLFMALK